VTQRVTFDACRIIARLEPVKSFFDSRVPASFESLRAVPRTSAEGLPPEAFGLISQVSPVFGGFLEQPPGFNVSHDLRLLIAFGGIGSTLVRSRHRDSVRNGTVIVTKQIRTVVLPFIATAPIGRPYRCCIPPPARNDSLVLRIARTMRHHRQLISGTDG
jgi:hypothetical protein